MDARNLPAGTDAIREQLLLAGRYDGTHLWILILVHHITDPEAALDPMVLDGDTLLGKGTAEFRCIWCRLPYVSPTDPPAECTG